MIPSSRRCHTVLSDRQGPDHRGLLGILSFGLALWLGPTTAAAQTDLPPDKGGTTHELGMPPVYKGNAGVMAGSYRTSGVSDLSATAHFGVQKDR